MHLLEEHEGMVMVEIDGVLYTLRPVVPRIGRGETPGDALRSSLRAIREEAVRAGISYAGERAVRGGVVSLPRTDEGWQAARAAHDARVRAVVDALTEGE